MTTRRIKTFTIRNGYRKQQIIEFGQTWKLTLFGSPAGIKFHINGTTCDVGEVIELENGDYPYTVDLPNSNYSIRAGTVSINSGDAVLDVSLFKDEKPTAFRVVNAGGSPMKDVKVYSDSELIGKTGADGKITLDAFPSGTHVIYAEYPGYFYKPQQKAISGGTVELAMSGNIDNTLGVLCVMSPIPDVNISVNNNTPVPFFGEQVPAGTYSVDVSATGYLPRHFDAKVVVGGVTYLPVKLSQDIQTGKLSVLTDLDNLPIGERPALLIDGSSYGSTPKTITLNSGVHSVLVRKNGYEDFSAKVVVEAGGVTMPGNPIILRPIVHPAAGTVLSKICKGFDSYNVVANGDGGTTDVLLEKNSPTCGFPDTKKLTVYSNLPALVTVRYTSGENIFIDQPTSPNTSNLQGKKHSISFDLSTSRTYSVYVRANPQGMTPAELLNGPYHDTETMVDFSDRLNISPEETIVTIKPMKKIEYVACYEFELSSQGYSPTQATTGSGYLSYNKDTNSIDASAVLLSYVGQISSISGNLSLTIKDSDNKTISTKTLAHGALAQNTSLSYALPISAVEVAFEQGRAVRSFKDETGKGVSDINWTGSSSFTYACRSWQGSTSYIPGKVRVNIEVPFTYRNPNG